MPASRFRPEPSSIVKQTWVITALMALTGVAFVIVQPAVRDSWAALARAQAVNEGVGLGYWFSWYSGGSPPGGYSVLVPWMSAALGAYAVCALAATAIPWAVMSAVRSSRHPVAAIWVAAICAELNMWSGRVTFVVGSAIAALGVTAAMRGRRWPAGILLVISGLASPVSVVFAVVGLAAGAWAKRVSYLPVVVGLVFLGISALVWGNSGPQGFGLPSALLCLVLLGLYLIAEPPRVMRYAMAIAAVGVIAVAIVPNSLGMNFARLVFAVMPVAVIATARARLRVAVLAVVGPLIWLSWFTVSDLRDAGDPVSQSANFVPLENALARQPQINSTRVEVVADGTQGASFVLARQFWLARGWETQADRKLSNAFVDTNVVMTPHYFTSWLYDSSVRYVAVSRHPIKETGEWRLAHRGGLPGWKRVWANQDWMLYQTPSAAPLVGSGATLVSRSPSQMTVRVDHPMTVRIRIVWSQFLQARGTDPQADPNTVATTSADGQGWTLLKVLRPGLITLSGRA